MSSHDEDGREYLKLSDAKAGMKVYLDDGFDCVPSGTVELKDCLTGVYFCCSEGDHFIEGQCDDGIHCVGIYKCE
jgi:hypothetical protein